LDKVVKQSDGYQIVISLKSGEYNIAVSDSSRQFSCGSQQVKVEKDMEVKFNCQVVPMPKPVESIEFVPLKINVTGRNATESWQNTTIRLNDTLLSKDKFRMKVLPTRTFQGRGSMRAFYLEITIHKMPVNKGFSAPVCAILSKVGTTVT
jgi:hypothetical protein